MNFHWTGGQSCGSTSRLLVHESLHDEVVERVLDGVSRVRDDDAVRLANDTPYGLTASGWPRDLTRAHDLAHRPDAGYVWVNCASAHFWGTPFGGVKDSGIGREEGADEVLSSTQTRTVNLRLR